MVLEDAIYNSEGMKHLITQVKQLVDDLAVREDMTALCDDKDARLKALQADYQQLKASSTDGVKPLRQEIEFLRNENHSLKTEILQLKSGSLMQS